MEWNRQVKFFMTSVVMILVMCLGTVSALASSTSLIPMGNSIGIQLQLSGVFVTSDLPLNEKNDWLKSGDQLLSVNEGKIISLQTINEIIKTVKDEDSVALTVLRGSKTLNVNTTGQSFKRALSFLKDTTDGTGTLTYVDSIGGNYGALGHQIIDSSLNSAPDFDSGSIYLSEIEQIKKSSPGNPGYKISSILDQENTLGSIMTNSVVGIFGEWNASYKEVLPKPIEVMQPTELTIGTAEILTTI